MEAIYMAVIRGAKKHGGQGPLAAVVGVDENTISRWKTGAARQISVEKLGRLLEEADMQIVVKSEAMRAVPLLGTADQLAEAMRPAIEQITGEAVQTILGNLIKNALRKEDQGAGD